MAKFPDQIVIKIDAKNAVVIRMGEWKGKVKVYIQGGYVPGDDYGSDLMVQPNETWPDGLAFGKAVTFPPEKLPLIVQAISRFYAASPNPKLKAKDSKESKEKPATAGKAEPPKKSKKATAEAIAPEPTTEEVDEDDPDNF